MSICRDCDHNACPGDARCCVLAREQVLTKFGVRSKYQRCPDFVPGTKLDFAPRNQTGRTA